MSKIQFATIGLLGLAAVLPSPLAAQQPMLEVQTTHQDPGGGLQSLSGVLGPSLLGGTLPALRYSNDGVSPGLQVRAANPILCSRNQQAGTNVSRQMVIDPNGYYHPVALADHAVLRESGAVLNYGSGALMQGSQVLRFGLAGLTGNTPNLAFYVDGVGAYCTSPAEVDVPAFEPACNTAAFEDQINRAGFETNSPGTLVLSVSSRLLPPANTRVEYIYTLQAQGGPVFDVDLREQFPYFQTASNTSPTFGRSYAFEENWSCSASNGANCDLRGRSLDGAGYVHLDGGKIEEGACLRIRTERGRRTDGIEGSQAFSGRLYTAAFYTVAPGPSEPANRTHRSQRHVLP